MTYRGVHVLRVLFSISLPLLFIIIGMEVFTLCTYFASLVFLAFGNVPPFMFVEECYLLVCHHQHVFFSHGCVVFVSPNDQIRFPFLLNIL